MKSTKRLIAVLTLAVCISACSVETSHKIIKENVNSEWQKVNLNRVAIVVVSDDRADRVSNESVFAAEFTARGVTAESSYGFVPDLGVILTEDDIRQALDGRNFDAFLTLGVIETAKEYEYTDWYATSGLMLILGASSRTARNVADLKDASDFYGEGNFKLDVALWDARTLQPIWNSTIEAYEFDQGPSGVTKLADAMVDMMAERGLVNSD